MSEQIRRLENRVHLAGALAELDKIKRGATEDGIPYISFNGAIQCGENAVSTVRFRTFVKSKKSDGSDSKIFAKIGKWVDSAVPMTADKDNPTYVDMVGSVTDNPYVDPNGQLHEAVQFNMQLFNDFTEYAADIDLEGYIYSLKPETRGEDGEETGRLKMSMIARDFFGNTLDIKSLYITEDMVEAFEDAGYEKGSTAKMFLSLIPNKVPVSTKKGGFGVQRTDAKSYLEWIVVGADPVIDPDSEKALDPKLIRAATTERKAHLDEVLRAGYQGNKSSSDTSVSTKETAPKKSVSKASASPVDDDDFPF